MWLAISSNDSHAYMCLYTHMCVCSYTEVPQNSFLLA